MTSDGQIVFLGDEPDENIRIVNVAGKKWYRGPKGWVREEWCGRFPDGTVRAPWLDAQFFSLWEAEGPEAARDKSKYDLSYSDGGVEDALD